MRQGSWLRRKFLIIALLLAFVALVCGIGGYVYWQRLKTTPQYSLALLIDAARRGDQPVVDELVDSDKMVDDFVPQIIEKAIELYGRGLPPAFVSQIASVAAPLMPAIRDKARSELPNLIRKETARFENVPFAAMVIGADRYLIIEAYGEDATIRSKLPRHSFEVKMRRVGSRWQIVGIRDEQLATRVAQTIGQQIIGAASKGDLRQAANELGVSDLKDMIREAEKIFE